MPKSSYYIYYDRKKIIRSVSKDPIINNLYKEIKTEIHMDTNIVGRKIVDHNGLRLAVIANWGDECGISTYTKFLVDSLRPKVAEIKIFSERAENEGGEAVYCWKRGESMYEATKRVLEYNPDVVLIQHEFGLFPKASYLLQMLSMLQDTPYVITLHSVYEHLDKAVCTAPMKNIIVHSETGKDCLRRLGNTSNITVIPHGCISFGNIKENWNIYQTFSVMQFGFGFRYKGVETALNAIHKLKSEQPGKFGDIFFTYLCSENPHLKAVNNAYYNELQARIDSLKLRDNVAVIRGYQTEQTLNHFLRTNKCAVFPYQTDPQNVVYGASGAIRIAMANRLPVIASGSHMFDDVDGILPRPKDYVELAGEIDRVYSDENYRRTLIGNAVQFIEQNSWTAVADRYLELMQTLALDGATGYQRV